MTTKAKTTTETTAKAAEEVFETVMETGAQTFDNIVKASVDAATKGYEKATAYSAAELGKTTDALKKAEKFGKDNAATFDAVTKAWTEGMDVYRTRMLDSWKDMAAMNMACMDKMMGMQNPQEMATVQMETMVEVSQKSVANAIELNKIAFDMFSKAAAPAKARAEEVMEMTMKAA